MKTKSLISDKKYLAKSEYFFKIKMNHWNIWRMT